MCVGELVCVGSACCPIISTAGHGKLLLLAGLESVLLLLLSTEVAGQGVGCEEQLVPASLLAKSQGVCGDGSAGTKKGSTPAIASKHGRFACVMGDAEPPASLIAKPSLLCWGSEISGGNSVGGNGTNRLAQSVESIKGLVFDGVLCILVAQPTGVRSTSN